MDLLATIQLDNTKNLLQSTVLGQTNTFAYIANVL